jgi:Putative Ig domain
LVVAVALPTAARAATIAVNTNTDPTAVTMGQCSLREAIIASNTDTTDNGACTAGTSAGNTIELQATTYDLTIAPSGGDDATTGDLNVMAPVAIQGAGAASTEILQQKADRVFDIASAGVQISGVKIEGGSPPSPADGGGILIESPGALTLATSTVANNAAYDGGGLYVSAGGQATIDNSTIDANSSTDPPGGGFFGGGGGILAAGTLTATGTAVSNNASANVGGGLDLKAAATLSGVQVNGNSAYYQGGGIFTSTPAGQTVAISGSTVSGNTVSPPPSYSGEVFGGGILAQGALTLSDSWVHDNSAANPNVNPSTNPGGSGGGIFYFSEATNESLNVNGSTIGPNNQATDGDGIGMEWDLAPGTANVTRSTIVANTHGAQSGLGGGLFVGAKMTANLRDVTLAQNAGGFAEGDGGNVYAVSGATATFENTLIAQPFEGGNCAAAGNPLTTFSSMGGDEEYGDTGSAHSCNFVAAHDTFTSTDLTSSQLLDLANNGGPTETMALAPGSPPVDTGFGCQPTDQRGVPRPQGSACDSGAYELDTTPLAVTITSGPSGNVTTPNVSFSFSANQPATFMCQLDGGALASCNSPFSAGPLALGSHTFTVEGTDIPGNHSSASRSFTIVVSSPGAITSANHTTFTVGSAGSFTVTSSGNPTPSLSESGALPSGVSFTDHGDGTASLAGTPAAGTDGSYPITITAHNGIGADASQLFTLTVSPAAPSGGGGGGGGGGGATVPKVTAFSLSASAFPAAPSGPTVVAARTFGTIVSFKLSTAAAVKFSVQHKVPGHKKGKRCVKKGTGKRCMRTVTLGSFTVNGIAGNNHFRFTGRLHGHKLPRGNYTLVLIATDTAGQSKPHSHPFRIIK